MERKAAYTFDTFLRGWPATLSFLASFFVNSLIIISSSYNIPVQIGWELWLPIVSTHIKPGSFATTRLQENKTMKYNAQFPSAAHTSPVVHMQKSCIASVMALKENRAQLTITAKSAENQPTPAARLPALASPSHMEGQGNVLSLL